MAYTPLTLRRAESILGYSLTDAAGEREYTIVDNVLYTGVFTGTPTIDGYTGTFKTRFNGAQDTVYKNEIILDHRYCKGGVYKVTADWGSTALEAELKDFLDWVDAYDFDDAIDNADVRSLKIEDFSITSGTSEEGEQARNTSLRQAWGFYMRSPVIISVTPEHRNDWRYF